MNDDNIIDPSWEKKESEGSCELVIYCWECRKLFQLNPDMIAIAMVSKADLWEIYNYIVTTKCNECKIGKEK